MRQEVTIYNREALGKKRKAGEGVVQQDPIGNGGGHGTHRESRRTRNLPGSPNVRSVPPLSDCGDRRTTLGQDNSP